MEEIGTPIWRGREGPGKIICPEVTRTTPGDQSYDESHLRQNISLEGGGVLFVIILILRWEKIFISRGGPRGDLYRSVLRG